METERLRLRPCAPTDLDALHALWSDPEVGPWIGGAHARREESVEELEGNLAHQAAHGFSMWVAEERQGGDLVGEVGLQLLEGHGPEVEIGWSVARCRWGRGYAAEAARAWLDAGHERLGLERILAVVLPGNARSRGLCERLGMREAGRRDAYGAEHLLYVSARTPAAAAWSAAPR